MIVNTGEVQFTERLNRGEALAPIPGSQSRIAIARSSAAVYGANSGLAPLVVVTSGQRTSRFLDKTGAQHELVTQQGAVTGLPQTVHHRVNGALLAIIEYEWQAVEGGSVLTQQRLRVFKNGQVERVATLRVRDARTSFDLVGEVQRALPSSLVQMILPREAHAATGSTASAVIEDEERCFAEGLAVAAAGAAMGIECAMGGPLNPLCWVATAAYIAAAESWRRCRDTPPELPT